MKILHIGISEHLGGIETYLYKIAANIDLEKYQFEFLTYPGITPCFYEELCALGCRFQRVTPRKEGIFKFRKEFDALLKREKYDIVHCHLNSLSFIEPVNIALKNGIKVLVHSHNGSITGRRLSKLLHQVHYVILPRSKIDMIAVSDVAGRWMFGKKARFTILNNGVDLEKIKFSELGRNRIRGKLGLASEKLIVHIGAFRKQKNHAFLIDIFSELLKIEPSAKLVLVGEGELKIAIKNKVSELGIGDSVFFVGICKDVVDILSAGDYFLFPSLHEGFPIAMIEAEATGLYCVVSDTITSEVAVDGLCEYVSLDKPADEWARVIHNCCTFSDRSESTCRIREAGLDVESDILRLCKMYNNVARR